MKFRITTERVESEKRMIIKEQSILMNLVILFAYIINPLLAVPFIIYQYKVKRKYIITSIWIGLIMAYIAYHAKAIYKGDIETYTEWLSLYREVDLLRCFDRIYSGLYAMDVFFWLMSRMPDERLMIFFVAFILYFVDSYMVLRYFNNTSQYKRTTGMNVLLITILIVPFYYYISAIRSSIGITLVILAIYLEDVCKSKKRTAIFFYVIGALCHHSALVIIVIRLGYIVFKKLRWFYGLVIGTGIGLIGTGSITRFLNTRIGGLFGRALEMAIGYSASGDQVNDRWNVMVNNSISAKIWLIYFLFIVCVSLLISYLYLYHNKKCRTNMGYTLQVNLLALILGFMLFPNRVYLRYLSASWFFISCFKYEALFSSKFVYYRPLLKICIFLIGCLGFVQQLYNMFLTVDVSMFLVSISKGIFNVF